MPLRSAPKLLVATRNAGKLRELTQLLGDVPCDLVSLDDVGIDHEVDETGSTFDENATLKAEAYCRLSGLITLADDSGLEVDALGGEPGVHSARYAGPDATDADRVTFLLAKLADIPPRRPDRAIPLHHSHRRARRGRGAALRLLRGPYSLQTPRRKRFRLRPHLRVPRSGTHHG